MRSHRESDPPMQELSLTGLAGVARVQTDFLIELVEEGVLTPNGEHPHEWRFDIQCLKQVRIVQSLQYDLGVNLAGAALALELLSEIRGLRAQLQQRALYPRRGD